MINVLNVATRLALCHFAVFSENRINILKRGRDLGAILCACQDNLSGHEDQENNLGEHHSIDQTREEFWLVAAELAVCECQAFQTNRKANIC
jgi:hypothetical protein